MKTLNVTFTAKNTTNEEILTSEIDVIAYPSKDEVLTTILEENDIPEDEQENWELTDEITTDEDIHTNYKDIDNIFEYAEAYNESSYEMDVINAAIDCGIDFSEIDEAYNGEHDSNEDFARDMADQLGSVDKNAGWPNNCIDWEYAAKELMYDYSESNGHYFRAM